MASLRRTWLEVLSTRCSERLAKWRDLAPRATRQAHQSSMKRVAARYLVIDRILSPSGSQKSRGDMAIGTLDETTFVKILQQHLRPSSPVDSFEHLYGRERQLEQIKQAMYSPGRHVFVYGDRGVGKT